MKNLLNNKKYQYGDANKFRAFCEAIDEYNKWSKTAETGASQEGLIAKACEGIIVEPKRAKTVAVINAKKELCTPTEVELCESVYKEEKQIRENSILATLADDIKTMLKDNGFEGKNVNNKIIERVYTRRDGTKSTIGVNAKDFPEVCKGLLDPLNPTSSLPTSVWLATLKPTVVSTGEFVIEFRFVSSYYNQYKDEYSNCVWLLKYVPSDRAIVVVKNSTSFSSTIGLFNDFDDEDDDEE